MSNGLHRCDRRCRANHENSPAVFDACNMLMHYHIEHTKDGVTHWQTVSHCEDPLCNKVHDCAVFVISDPALLEKVKGLIKTEYAGSTSGADSAAAITEKAN